MNQNEREDENMMKTVLFLLLEQYADWEGAYIAPWIKYFGKDEWAVKTVSLTKEPVRSIGGFTVLPDYDIASAPKDFAALVLIGGNSWRSEAAKGIMPLVNTAIKNSAVLAGICDAAGFLGANGILNDIAHTANDLDDLKKWAKAAYNGEARFQKQQAVRDGKIVTANGTAALEFSREVLLALDLAPEQEILDGYYFYKAGYYGEKLHDYTH
jgi:putative intracellular protease/amidase